MTNLSSFLSNRPALLLLSLSGFLLSSCQSTPSDNSETTAQTETPAVDPTAPIEGAKTYAEISTYVGGKWEDRVYKGGTFQNIMELDVPPQLTDHSYYIRYEGPGWESNKVGYRLYLDWRNAIDIFGKKTNDIVLPGVGLDNYDSYHEMSDWGMDILKVGSSLGIGSVGRLVDNEVLHFKQVDKTVAKINNTDTHSSITINYTGWETKGEKVNLSSTLKIKPDERQTLHTIQTSAPLDGLCTGIVKLPDTDILSGTSTNGSWAYLATYGVQTLVPDKLGMAILYKIEDLEKTVDGKDDHLLVFKSTDQPINYYFLGAWEKETNGIKSKEAFELYLKELINTL